MAYTYDPAGNPTKVADTPFGKSADVQCYAYDGLSRLTEAWTPASGDCGATRDATKLGGPAPYWTSYAFNAVGARTSMTKHAAAGNTVTTYTYPAAGAARPHAAYRIVTTAPGGTATTNSYSWDASGNTATRVVAGQGTQTLTWDAEGELEKLVKPTGTDSYVYSADGDRLVRRQDGTTTIYLPGGQELQRTAAGVVSGVRYYEFDGQTVASITGTGNVSFQSTLIGDPQGTAQVQINASTNKITRRWQDPYGNPRGAAPAAWTGDHGFLDKPTDTTGLTQIGARYYDPVIGRFLSVDPVLDLANPGQWNPYAYANNNPITHSDPTGLFVPGFEFIFFLMFELPRLIAAIQAGGKPTTAKPPTTRTNQVDTKRAPRRILSDKDTWANLRSRPATSNHDMLRCHPRDPAMIARTRAGSAVIAGELLGITDIIECADGNKAGCLWLVAMIPIAKPLKVLKAGKIAEATATAAKTAEAAADSAKGAGKVADDVATPSVNWGQQEKHFPGHPSFMRGRSILTADPRILAQRAGSGAPVGNVARGEPGFKERIDFGEVIGQFSDRATGDLIPTSVGIVHHGSRGIHIVPARPLG